MRKKMSIYYVEIIYRFNLYLMDGFELKSMKYERVWENHENKVKTGN